MSKQVNGYGKKSRCNRTKRKGLWKGKEILTTTKKGK